MLLFYPFERCAGQGIANQVLQTAKCSIANVRNTLMFNHRCTKATIKHPRRNIHALCLFANNTINPKAKFRSAIKRHHQLNCLICPRMPGIVNRESGIVLSLSWCCTTKFACTVHWAMSRRTTCWPDAKQRSLQPEMPNWKRRARFVRTPDNNTV